MSNIPLRWDHHPAGFINESIFVIHLHQRQPVVEAIRAIELRRDNDLACGVYEADLLLVPHAKQTLFLRLDFYPRQPFLEVVTPVIRDGWVRLWGDDDPARAIDKPYLPILHNAK